MLHSLGEQSSFNLSNLSADSWNKFVPGPVNLCDGICNLPGMPVFDDPSLFIIELIPAWKSNPLAVLTRTKGLVCPRPW